MEAGLEKKPIYPVSEERRIEILTRIQSDQANKTQRLAVMQERQRVGLVIAQEAAKVLKEQFNATHVVLFGSLLSPEKMHERSDIDIAVWGLGDEQLFSAWSRLDSLLDSQAPFPHIDLVLVEKALPYMRKSIESMHLDL